MKSLIALAAVIPLAYSDPLWHGTGNAPNNLICPHGFILNGKKCEQTIVTNPTLHCPVGTLQNEQCVTNAPFIKQCPIGSAEEGKQCTVVHSMAPHAICPFGFLEQGNLCLQRIPLPLVEVCEMGRLEGNQCVITETADRVRRTFCPPGFYDDGKGCMKVTEYDCSPPYPSKGAAPLPLAPMLPLAQKKPRMLSGRRAKVYAPMPIPIPPPSKAMPFPAPVPILLAPVPPPKVDILKQTCQRKDFAPLVVETHCPQGFTDLGKTCQLVQRYPTVQKCSNGGPASACETMNQAPLELTCPKGILVGNLCQWKEPLPLETVCPAGTVSNGYECQQITQSMAKCPAETILDGRQCIGRIVAEPTGIVTKTCVGKECWNH